MLLIVIQCTFVLRELYTSFTSYTELSIKLNEYVDFLRYLSLTLYDMSSFLSFFFF
jgi:hypothetical protein